MYFGGPLILKERYDKSQSLSSFHTDINASAPANEDFDMFTIYIASLPKHIKKVNFYKLTSV